MSKFLCPLPWISISIHNTGEQRICCHSETPHSIPSTDINPLNNSVLVKLRKKMTNGEAPKECEVCFRYEQNNLPSPRERYLKDFSNQFETSLKKMKDNGTLDSNHIEFLDLSLGNQCNSTCLICHPYYSDQISKHFNSEENTETLKKIKDHSSQADLKRIQELSIDTVYFQGGEPLLSKRHIPLLDDIIETREADRMSLTYDTNLSILPKDVLKRWERFKEVNLSISLDGTEEIQEYLRPPTKWDNLTRNIEKIKNIPNVTFSFKTVLYALNLNSLIDIFEFTNTHSSNPPQVIFLETPFALKITNLSQSKIDEATQEWLRYITENPKMDPDKKIYQFLANITGEETLSPYLLVYLRKLEKQYRLQRPQKVSHLIS